MTKYYDLTDSLLNLIWFFIFGFVALTGCVIIWVRFMIQKAPFSDKKVIGFFILGTFIWTAIIGGPFANYLGARTALKNGTYQVVEGAVEHFSPMPMGGHGHESFSVKGVSFKYGESSIDFGFDKSRINGGPVYQGKQVKIHYYKGRILRLWVCDTCAFNPGGVEWKE